MKTKRKLNINTIYKLLKYQLQKSYAVYSNFYVSAILETKDKFNYRYYFGNNIENKSYGLTMCAERNVIFNFLSNKKKNEKILNLYILANNKSNTYKEIIYPCAACLGVINEFFKNDSNIVCFSMVKRIKSLKINQLLPFTFHLND